MSTHNIGFYGELKLSQNYHQILPLIILPTPTPNKYLDSLTLNTLISTAADDMLIFEERGEGWGAFFRENKA